MRYVAYECTYHIVLMLDHHHFCCSVLVFLRQNHITLPVNFHLNKVSNKDFFYPSVIAHREICLSFVYFSEQSFFWHPIIIIIHKVSSEKPQIKSWIVLDHKLYGLWQSLMDGQFTPGKRFREKCQQILKEIWANFLFNITILACNNTMRSVSLSFVIWQRKRTCFLRVLPPTPPPKKPVWLNFLFK